MIRAIIATDPSGIIGVKVREPAEGGFVFRWKMPWYYKHDLRRFKHTTMGGVLIMGRTTWESLPGKLPGRDHIVLTRRSVPPWDGPAPDGCFVAHSLEEALELREPDEDIWIAGGREVYNAAFEQGLVQEIDHTIVPAVNIEAHENVIETVRFDVLKLPGFDLVSEEVNPDDERLTHRLLRCRTPA